MENPDFSDPIIVFALHFLGSESSGANQVGAAFVPILDEVDDRTLPRTVSPSIRINLTDELRLKLIKQARIREIEFDCGYAAQDRPKIVAELNRKLPAVFAVNPERHRSLSGDVEQCALPIIDAKRLAQVIANINRMHSKLGRPGSPSEIAAGIDNTPFPSPSKESNFGSPLLQFYMSPLLSLLPNDNFQSGQMPELVLPPGSSTRRRLSL